MPKARFLFDVAVAKAWDDEFGGLCYSIDLDGAVCNGDKIFWVQCESIGTAAMLATVTGEAKYWAIYDKLWRYSWDKWVDHEHGSWLRRMSREHVPYFTEKTNIVVCGPGLPRAPTRCLRYEGRRRGLKLGNLPSTTPPGSKYRPAFARSIQSRVVAAARAASAPAPPSVVRVRGSSSKAAARLGRRRAVAVWCATAPAHRAREFVARGARLHQILHEGLALRPRALQLLPISAGLRRVPRLQQELRRQRHANTLRKIPQGQHQCVVPLPLEVGREERVAVRSRHVRHANHSRQRAPFLASTGGGFDGRSSSSYKAQTTSAACFGADGGLLVASAASLRASSVRSCVAFWRSPLFTAATQ